MEKIRTVKRSEHLYSRNSAGRVLEWVIFVEEYSDPDISRDYIYKISTYSGLFGTALSNVPSTYIVRLGKNLGKANATTALEQALKEAEAKFEYKIKRNNYYTLSSLGITKTPPNLNEIDFEKVLDTSTTSEGFYIPMKAQPFWKTKKVKGESTLVPRIKFPCIGQAKINGYRVTVNYRFAENEVHLLSKKGVRYNIPHIENAYKKVYKELYENLGEIAYDVVIDGEMYIKGYILSDITSACSSTVKGQGNNLTTMLTHYIFDICDTNLIQEHRTDFIENDLARIINYENLTSLKVVMSTPIENVQKAEQFTDACIAEGDEGGIFRDKNAVYKPGKRPMTMVKLKRNKSKEFKIVDVIGWEKNPNLGVFVCKNDLTSDTFEVTPEGTASVRAEYLKNKSNYIGKELTVEYRERTVNKIPFHAVGIVVRDYE